MGIHLAHASLTTGTIDVSVDTDFTFVPTPDGLLPVVGSQFQVSRPLRVAAAWAGAETATLFPASATDSLADVRIETPALASISPASIRPLAPLVSGLPLDGLRVADFACDPLPLRAGDPLSVIGTVAPSGTGGSVSVAAHALIWFSDGCQPVPPRPAITVPFVLAAAPPTTTLAWVASAIRFLRPLPGRRFAIIGIELVASAGILAARLSLPGSPLKPGVIAASGANATSFRQARVLESLHMGVLGVFDAFAPPTLETLSVASPAAANIRGWLTIVPVDSADTSEARGCGDGR